MKNEIKPFDMQKKPIKERWFLTPLKWALALPVTFMRGLKVNRVQMEGLKPPYLLLCTHHGFIDFKVQTRVLFPHTATYVVAVDGFIGREWLLRNVGGIGKRKFTPQDRVLFKNIKYSLDELKVITTIYAESAYSIAGTTSRLPDSLFKVIKVLNYPVVVLNMHGNFLTQPNYSMPKPRKIKLEADLTQVITKKDLETITFDEIKERVTKAFHYDEWQYQLDHQIQIKDSNRAKSLNKILYTCETCLKEHEMIGEGTKITCQSCGTTHELDHFGQLHKINGETKFNHVPNWYEMQRNIVHQNLLSGNYFFESDVYIDSLRNAKGFRHVGIGKLTHDINGIHLTFNSMDETIDITRETKSLYTIHIEFDYKKTDKIKSDGIVISTESDTFYCYPIDKRDVVVKFRFAVEEAYQITMSKA